MKPSEPPVTDGCVRLYHGTTDEAAASIMLNGFRPLQVQETVGAIAKQYGFSVIDILGAAEYTFLVNAYRVEGDEHIYFGGDMLDVAFWARIGSEARWEALIAVYRLRHPKAALDDPAAAEWAEHETPHIPTVVLVDVPFEELFPESRLSFAEWSSQPNRLQKVGLLALPMPVPKEWLVTSMPVERTYTASEIAKVAGVSWEDVIDLIEEGKLPASDGPPWPEVPVWWQSSVEAFLRAHGLST